MAAQLQSALDAIKGLEATVSVQSNELIQVCVLLDEKDARIVDLVAKTIKMLEEKKHVLSYDDLKPGGILEKYVNDFTYFPSFNAHDAFLDLINFTEKCEPGNGLCENMVRYSTISMEKRKEYHNARRAERDNHDMDIDDADDAGTGLDEIADASIDEESNSKTSKRGPQRKLHWKTEYLVYCMYTR